MTRALKQPMLFFMISAHLEIRRARNHCGLKHVRQDLP